MRILSTAAQLEVSKHVALSLRALTLSGDGEVMTAAAQRFLDETRHSRALRAKLAREEAEREAAEANAEGRDVQG